MNAAHLDDYILQQIAIDKTNIPATAMDHYKSCITCRQTAEKYAFILDQLAHEQRPVLSAEATQMILARLPLIRWNTKNHWLLFAVCVGILVCLSILWYLLKEFREKLPLIASGGGLLIVAIIVVNEIIDRFKKYQRKISALETT
jgi:uncharacterized membrane protein